MTSKPIAWINGQYKPIAETSLHVFDKGIVHGASVTEMLRTFRHQPFRVEEHLDRLRAGINVIHPPPPAKVMEDVVQVCGSLEGAGYWCWMPNEQWAGIIANIVEHNSPLIPANHDLGIIVFATAGTNLTYIGVCPDVVPVTSTVCIHTFPLPFELWAEKVTHGQKLVIPKVRAIPPECIDPRIKHRSRLHWVLADNEARQTVPGASALVLDLEGRITETSSGNFFAVIEGEIVTPPPERCLGGISQAVVRELAGDLKIPYRAADLRPEDLRHATEAFTTSTPYCLMPVASVEGQFIGRRIPGPVYRKLIAGWNALVGVDIIGQIQQGAEERLASAR